MKNPLEWLKPADRLQRRVSLLAFPIAVWKKFSDDQAGNLAALIAYYSFVSLFPLMLVLVTLLDIVARNNPELRTRVLRSALHAYPVIGPQIASSVHGLHKTGLALAIGLLGALLGGRGVASAMQNALSVIWAVPHDRRLGFPWSTLRGMAMVVVFGVGQIVTTTLSGIAGGLGHLVTGPVATIGAIALSLVLNVGLFWLSFWLATPKEVGWRALRLGAILSAASWQVLLLFGTYIVGHFLRNSSAVYGVFGLVLGLLAWLYLQAQITLYAVEACTVLEWRLWPRGLIVPPLTEQDRRAYRTYDRAAERKPPDGDRDSVGAEVDRAAEGKPPDGDRDNVGAEVDGDG